MAQPYRKQKKTKLQRTFVSASDAAEDRAKGVKRQGGVIIDDQPKPAKIQFVAANNGNDGTNDSYNANNTRHEDTSNTSNGKSLTEETGNDKIKQLNVNNYLEEMVKLDCLDVRGFREYMFNSVFGRMVLLIRPWASKIWNIQSK